MSDQEEFETETETEQDIILTAEDLRKLSPLDWARYGTNRIAYLRPVMVNNQRSVAIHAADGTQIGAAPDYALAAAAIFQHDGCGAGALTSTLHHFTRASFCSTSAAITPPP